MPTRYDALAASFVAAFNASDTERMSELSTPDVEVRPLRALLEDIVYRGSAGHEEWASDIRETWAELSLEAGETSEVGDNLFLLEGVFHARGRSTNAPAQVSVYFITEIRDGLVASINTFVDRDEAIRTASATPEGR